MQYLEVVIASTQVQHYKNLIRQKIGSEQSKIAEARLVLPIIFHEHIEHPITVAGIYHNLIFAFDRKLRRIKRKIYRNYWEDEGMLWRLCVLHQFAKFTKEMVGMLKKSRGAVNAETVWRWKDKKCEQEQEQQKAYQVIGLSSDILNIYLMLGVIITCYIHRIINPGWISGIHT